MLHPAPDAELLAIATGERSVLERLTPCDQTALQQLSCAFEAARPAAILIGDGRARSSQVIDNFLTGIDDTTSVARISNPVGDATSCMRAVVSSMGFEPKDFCLADLENIFTMFLRHQKTHVRRTVVCIEDAQGCDAWVLNKFCELAELESNEQFGLFVIVSGRRKMKDLLYRQPLQDLAAFAGRYISVSPLALAETRQLVLQQIESEASREASEIIDFDAITALHEIGAGIPDTVSGLCTKSLELAARESAYPITENAISRAACTLGLAAAAEPGSVETVENDEDSVDAAHTGGWLSVRLRDKLFVNRAIDSDCFSIGRDATNDLCIPSMLVSRQHVLIVTSAKGVEIVDVGSMNGTFVNDRRVKSHVLSGGDRIRLGDCWIEYAVSN